MFSRIWSNWPKYQGRPTHFRCKNSGKSRHQNLCLLLKCEMSTLVLLVKIKLQHIHTHTFFDDYIYIYLYMHVYWQYIINALAIYTPHYLLYVAITICIQWLPKSIPSRWSSWRVLRLVWATQEMVSMANPESQQAWKPKRRYLENPTEIQGFIATADEPPGVFKMGLLKRAISVEG